MNELQQSIEELRRMSAAELVQVGEDSLLNRLREQAEEARQRHGTLGPANLQALLEDPDTVRYPTRLVLEYGEMGVHQFAQPEPDYRNPGGRMLYIRPILGQRPDFLVLAVSYMIPIINYGDLISDQHCLVYGAALLGLDEETYYQKVCQMADFTGALSMARTDPDAQQPNGLEEEPGESGGCGCGSGCGCG